MATTEMNCLASGGGVVGHCESFSPSASQFTEIELGFAPKMVMFYTLYNNSNVITLRYDVENDKLYQSYTSWEVDKTSDFIGQNKFIYVDGTKVYYKAYASGYYTWTTMVIAY